MSHANAAARMFMVSTVTARDAAVAAHDLLSPAVLRHSHRAYAWGAALAGVHVFGLRAGDDPDAVRRRVVHKTPRPGFRQEFTRLRRAEARQVPEGEPRTSAATRRPT